MTHLAMHRLFLVAGGMLTGNLACNEQRPTALLNSAQCTVLPNNNEAAGSRHQQGSDEEDLG